MALTPDKISVLIVDDAAAQRHVLSRALSKNGFQTFQAENGQEALNLIRCLQADNEQEALDLIRRLQAGNEQEALDLIRRLQETVDIVLMDIQMPIVDGTEGTRRIRDAGYNLPILGIGATERPLDTLPGMQEFFLKPINIPELIATIQRLVNDSLPPEEITWKK